MHIYIYIHGDRGHLVSHHAQFHVGHSPVGELATHINIKYIVLWVLHDCFHDYWHWCYDLFQSMVPEHDFVAPIFSLYIFYFYLQLIMDLVFLTLICDGKAKPVQKKMAIYCSFQGAMFSFSANLK